MRLCGGWLLLTGVLAAQAPKVPGVVRGTLLENERSEVSVRTSTNEVFRFRFDEHTYCERDNARILPPALRAGELLEVVADPIPDTVLRYARTIHVIEPERPHRPPPRRLMPWQNPIEHLAPTGNLTFSGIVNRVNRTQLVLRVRGGEDKILILRQDTRYLEDGSTVESVSLKPNTRVFVRAGRSLYGDLEAYQVIWGEILQPQAEQ